MEDSVIGLFGGTFNPIHFGHLSLALSIQEACQLSEVWFIPNNSSPFKMEDKKASPQDRYEMTKLAIEPIPSFKVIDCEIKREAPSYTFDTIVQLQQAYPNQTFAFMLSDEVYQQFDRWHKSDEIKKRIQLLIGSRGGQEGKIKTPLLEISGTQIRDRIKKHLYCGHLVPGKVLDYISENQLYSTS